MEAEGVQKFYKTYSIYALYVIHVFVLCKYQIHTMRTLSKNIIHESVSMLSNNGHVLSRNSDLSGS